jgi:hypothetical protein
MDRFKEQLFSFRIKEGMQQIASGGRAPKLVPTLSMYSNKKMSSLSDK